MKKILIIAVVFLSLQTFAQRTVTIYNLSNTNFDIGELDTRSTNANTYPRIKSNYGTAPNNIIHIPAGTTYVLQASPNTLFPFLSPSSSPQITSWMRQLTAGGSWSTITSSVASTLYGNTQNFDFIKTQVGPNGSLGGGTLTSTGPSYSAFYTFGTTGNVSLDVQDANGNHIPNGAAFIVISN